MRRDTVISIAKKEIMDNIRNKWIILVSIMFAGLTLVVSYFGSITSHGWQNLGLTIAGMTSFATYLISIIGFMLGYASIIGEIERGSMSALLSLAATRFEIVVGKFFGLGAVLCFTVLVGFGFAGIVIGVNVSNVDYIQFLAFIGMTMIFGLVFLSVALCFSTVFSKRSTALGGTIFLWFLFVIILPIVFAGLLVSTVGLTNLTAGNIPEWYYVTTLFNPIDVYSSLISITIRPVSTSISGVVPYPAWYSPGLLLGVLFVWIVVFFVLAAWRFNRKDV
ncbi:MAG TPA: ABC transporter permease subunit [Candidatus Thermoplasmatota archaeon]|nr:ABC transporter permease subunit [Candidatus Thermoplasmatota archaeon]